MTVLSVSLFGRLRMKWGDQDLNGLGSSKAQHLFCYLALFQQRAHPRDTLIGRLWPDFSEFQAKKNLRQTLWQLQSELETQTENRQVLLVDSDWIQFNPYLSLWTDVSSFEASLVRTEVASGHELSHEDALNLETAVQLYKGDLLEGWYDDWTLFERERLRRIYLEILTKLIAYYEANKRYEAGLAHARRILAYDQAHERTHRQLMRLYYLSGDRTAALRQYDRCRIALKEELGVDPAEKTEHLFRLLCSDKLHADDAERSSPPIMAARGATSLEVWLDELHRLQSALSQVQESLQEQIEALELALNSHS